MHITDTRNPPSSFWEFLLCLSQNSYDLYKSKSLKDSKMDLGILGVCYFPLMLIFLGWRCWHWRRNRFVWSCQCKRRRTFRQCTSMVILYCTRSWYERVKYVACHSRPCFGTIRICIKIGWRTTEINTLLHGFCTL